MAALQRKPAVATVGWLEARRITG